MNPTIFKKLLESSKASAVYQKSADVTETHTPSVIYASASGIVAVGRLKDDGFYYFENDEGAPMEILYPPFCMGNAHGVTVIGKFNKSDGTYHFYNVNFEATMKAATTTATTTTKGVVTEANSNGLFLVLVVLLGFILLSKFST